jgi:hypothetical protein
MDTSWALLSVSYLYLLWKIFFFLHVGPVFKKSFLFLFGACGTQQIAKLMNELNEQTFDLEVKGIFSLLCCYIWFLFFLVSCRIFLPMLTQEYLELCVVSHYCYIIQQQHSIPMIHIGESWICVVGCRSEQLIIAFCENSYKQRLVAINKQTYLFGKKLFRV